MREKWYGDNRDLVKWTTLVHIAHTRKLRSILQVPYWRPELEHPQVVFSENESENKIDMPKEIWGFFRDIRKIANLGGEIDISVGVVMDEFKPDGRTAYLRCVKERVAKTTPPLLLFLDPDTGLQPKRAKAEHTTDEEVKELWKALKSRDWFVLYQHVPLYLHARRQTGWAKAVKTKLAELCGGATVKTARSTNVGKDVVFLCIEKPGLGPATTT